MNRRVASNNAADRGVYRGGCFANPLRIINDTDEGLNFFLVTQVWTARKIHTLRYFKGAFLLSE